MGTAETITQFSLREICQAHRVALAMAWLLIVNTLAGEPSVKIEHGWVRAVPPSSSGTAAYMTLVNSSDQTVRLLRGNTPIAETLIPMTTTKRTINGQELLGMKRVDELAIPAHGKLMLTPDGDHLMLVTLKQFPKPGEKVKLTLHFEPDGKDLTVELPVEFNRP